VAKPLISPLIHLERGAKSTTPGRQFIGGGSAFTRISQWHSKVASNSDYRSLVGVSIVFNPHDIGERSPMFSSIEYQGPRRGGALWLEFHDGRFSIHRLDENIFAAQMVGCDTSVSGHFPRSEVAGWNAGYSCPCSVASTPSDLHNRTMVEFLEQPIVLNSWTFTNQAPAKRGGRALELRVYEPFSNHTGNSTLRAGEWADLVRSFEANKIFRRPIFSTHRRRCES